jgi:hypothetical protein
MTALLQRTRSCGAPSGATDSAGSPKHCGSKAKPHCCRIKRTRLQRRTISADPWIWRVARGVLGACRCRTRVAAALVISPVQNDVIALIGAWPPSVGRSKVARGSAQIIQQSGSAVLPSCRAVDERFGRGRVTPRSGLDVISRSWREFHIRVLRPRGTEGSNPAPSPGESGDQLPSVGPGQVLADIIASGASLAEPVRSDLAERTLKLRQ